MANIQYVFSETSGKDITNLMKIDNDKVVVARSHMLEDSYEVKLKATTTHDQILEKTIQLQQC